MKRFIPIILATCLTILWSGSCSFGDWESPVSVKASVICFYEDNIEQRASLGTEFPNDRLKKEDIDRLIEDLTEELNEGFTDARMTLDFFDSIGEWLYKQVYYIDSELRWERSY